MTTTIVEEVEEVSEAGLDETIHIACCCSPRISMCGTETDLDEGWAENAPEPNDCVVCVSIAAGPCPRCKSTYVCIHGHPVGTCPIYTPRVDYP